MPLRYKYVNIVSNNTYLADILKKLKKNLHFKKSYSKIFPRGAKNDKIFKTKNNIC